MLDTHGFRQTQTAVSAYWLARDGLSIDYATPVVGAPWAIPYEFPIYQSAVALLHRATGMPLDPAGRTVALGFFYLSLPAVWLLLRRLDVAPGHRWLFLALMVTCPVYQFYSRAFLIESTAFCLSAWFLLSFHRAIASTTRWPVVLAGILGGVAALGKITTYAVFLVPAAWMALSAWRAASRTRVPVIVRAALSAGPGVLLAAWWVEHTDALKRQNVFGALQTSAALHDWNYGTLAQRCTMQFWQGLGVHINNALFPTASLLLGGVVMLLFMRGRWRLWCALLGVAMAGPLVFANLYFVHDYYFYASGAFFLLLLALPLRQLLDRAMVPPLARVAVVVLVLVAQFGGYLRVFFPPQARAAFEPPALATAIKRATKPDDILLGFGMNWSPVLPYYSERRAVMVPDAKLQDNATISEALGRVTPARVAAVLIARHIQPNPEAYFPWLNRLDMDPTPLVSTGEYSVYLRRDMITEALRSLRDAKLDLFLYNGQIGQPGAQSSLVFWAEHVADQQLFASMHPKPVRVITPFGLTREIVDGRVVFTAPASTEIEIPVPAAAKRLRAQFGINSKAYAHSDGVEFEITFQQKTGASLQLYRRLLQPWLLATDQGLQTIDLEWVPGIEGALVFRTRPGPGNQSNYDWSYWAEIDVR